MSSPTFDAEPESARTGIERRQWVKPALCVLLLAAAVWLGRDFGRNLPLLERWVSSHGFWGFALFVGAMIVFTSLFIPDTVFAVTAGVLFGLFWGTVLVSAGSILTSVIDFAVSRLFLQNIVRRWLARNPRMAAIERAVNREGFRFQFLLRLSPLSPVAVSYALGATNTRYPIFFAACFGVVPGLFVEVYFGHVAKHVAKISGKVEASSLHTALTILGLLLCVGLMFYITRLARKAINEESCKQLTSVL